MTAVAAVSVIGMMGSLVYWALGIRCPFATVGAACPGCGCGTAARLLIGDGPATMVQKEPTSSLLLVVLLVAAISSLVIIATNASNKVQTAWSRMGWFVLIVVASANAIFQMYVR
jgi:hypothetical protein